MHFKLLALLSRFEYIILYNIIPIYIVKTSILIFITIVRLQQLLFGLLVYSKLKNIDESYKCFSLNTNMIFVETHILYIFIVFFFNNINYCLRVLIVKREYI